MRVACNGKDKVYTLTCEKCNSDLEYTEDDVYYVEEARRGMPYIGGYNNKIPVYVFDVYKKVYRCVKCPVCGCDVHIGTAESNEIIGRGLPFRGLYG